MKRFVLPAFFIAYVALGIFLSVQMPQPGVVQWRNPATEKMKIYVASNRAVITMEEVDFETTEFVRARSDGQILLKITGGKPTRLKGPIPGGIILINPAGVFVGPDSMVDVGKTSAFSTLDIKPDNILVNGSIIDFLPAESFDGSQLAPPKSGDIALLGNSPPRDSSAVELKAKGNVYALAINREGKVQANGENPGPSRVRANRGPDGNLLLIDEAGDRRVILTKEPWEKSSR